LEIQRRHLAKIELGRPLSVADCTAENARAWGITAEIHSSPDYKSTQAWASAFAQAGFDGIRYFLRHDPAQRLVGFALFGSESAPSGLPVAFSQPIEKDLLRQVEDRFGLRVKPAL